MSETKIVRAKIALNSKDGVKEFRRISVTSFSDLCISIERFCGSKIGDLKVEYLDGDGDWVRFSTEEEFEEMKRYVKDCGNMKIQVNREVETSELKRDVNEPFWRRRMRHHHHHRRHHPSFQRGAGSFKNHHNMKRIFGPRRCHLPPFIFQFHPVRGFGRFGKHPSPNRAEEGGFRFGFGKRGGGPKHWGITCDGCGKQAWRGLRFKCSDCPAIPGYDLCGRCMKTSKDEQKHDPSHKFERIPLMRRSCGRGRRRFVKVTKNEEEKGETSTTTTTTTTSQDDKNIMEEEKKSEILYPEEEEEETEGEEIDDDDHKDVEVKIIKNEGMRADDEVHVVLTAEDQYEPKKKNMQFEIQLKLLGEMGFKDEERNYNLLVEEGGDMKKVVGKLLHLM